jgi:Flp pilus assembly protein CpaB
MTYRLRNIAVAVGLALVAALLTTFYVANYKRHVQQSESTVKVFVAKRDIPTGTPGADLVAHGWLTTADVVSRTVVPGAMTNQQQILSLISSQNIYAGEQITLRRFASHTEIGVRAQLHGTFRAISVPGTNDQLLAGTLRDGDRVDLLAKIGGSDTSGSGNSATRVVVRNLLVLHAPVTGTSSKVSSASGTTASVMLAVSDKKTEQKVWHAANSSVWTLALRPVAKTIDSAEEVETDKTVLNDGLGAKELAKLNALATSGSGQ